MEVDIYQFFDKVPRDAGLRHELVQRTKRLRKEGYATALLTNNIKEFGDSWRGLLHADDLFDLVMDSRTEGVRKPNPAILQITLERRGRLAPEHAVFLDDLEVNVAVAESLGMHTVLVGRDISRAIAGLDTILYQTGQYSI